MIKNKIHRVIGALLALPLLVLGVVAVPSTALAETINCSTTQLTLENGAKCAKGTSQDASLVNVFSTVVNILLFLVGAVAVIMLVIGGLRYVTSNGDQNAVTGAKNTILYAIIGIVVAFLAYAAVGFVTSQLQAGTTNTNTTR